MFRRSFLKASAVAGAIALASTLTMSASHAQRATSGNTAERPIRIIMGGYGPPTTSFSVALKQIGDRLEAKFPDQVEVRYVYNIMDLGYLGSDILWLVENGVLTLGYQSSSYLTDRVPELGLADLPFLFSDTESARTAMDGHFGELMAEAIEANMNYRILGYFENGLRHISNRVRPIRSPADLQGISIRVLPSEVMRWTFELFGADPEIMDLTAVITRITEGTIDAQENPLANTVTYGVHNFHRYHSITNHLYLSRPIFLHRQSFDSWPKPIQDEMRAAIIDAIAVQRVTKTQEELDAAKAILDAGGEIIELTPEQLQPFKDAVAPIYEDARSRYSRELLDLVGL
ncbi:MAG: TRAP transporter substrate-binding protein [Gammaproteobacteria bacterium]|nr:TRAP transporter substrate-binding protein [Gammaproteobacteria bacterium]MDH3506327.1 TRAP transporter substrate-binding protein [Gammaproteobacteria bacterium]